MTQVADRVALPIRVHDLLLGLAGRLDDDALTDARELLASAELDRSLELIGGCLVAGRIPLSPVERRDLDAMFAEANCDTTLIQQLKVDDGRARPPVHRFHPGLVDSQIGGAEAGVSEAVHRVLEVLPDVRALWCVWRTTPAGAVAGPVPHRIVLVEIGPRGFPPATAYRIEHALRRAGIRAAVEVLRDNSPLTEYHRQGMQQARRVSFDGAPDEQPVAAEPPRRTWGQQRETWKEEAAPVKPTATDEPQPSTSSWIPEMEPSAAPAGKAPEPSPKETTTVLDPVTDPAIDPVVDVPAEPTPRPERPNFDQPGLRQVTPPIDEPEPVTLPKKPTPTPSPVSAKDTFEDSDLNDQERDLLRQLQEELAKREQAEAASSNKKLSWQTDKSGRHADAEAKWSSPSTPRVINGVPPTAGGTVEPPRFPPTA
ncbi:hypothetical protein [Kibdelosporangium phytohabitans]|uniref:Uncharacterized protein n=1 Tax=Kibdelosporangium phytohabitans TaxID=860235 RepID=A0A0N9HRW4_9PSEU|nr:hypothetical protein [Kibdelosporangium phytohabitans]ALG05801.1 hypothetical protein AOZ06_01665 [Kibdelosporangium phytohabitans]MBE1466185.1 hypothetical protein [Kibdelosporangium phytohabitans]